MIIKNAEIALSGIDTPQKAELKIESGVITEIGESLSGSEEVLDAGGCLVIPGGIDPHVHFFDPGFTAKEDFDHGCRNAAAGGITTIIDMPCTSIPPVTNKRNLDKKLEVIAPKAVIDFGLFAGISDQSYLEGYENNMEELAPHVLGFKNYAISGMESFARIDHFQLRNILSKSAELNIPVLLHAEDADYINRATPLYQAQGQTAEHYYLSRPEIAETLAVQAAIEIANDTGGQLHIVHIGTAAAAELLKSSHTTGETCPQYLEFDLEDFKRQIGLLKIAPSIKKAENKERLWELLKDGTIDFVASDHAPGTVEEKSGDNIWKHSSGIAGCGTMLPYMLSEGYLSNRLSLSGYLQIMSENAAKRYGLFDRKGSIAVGKDADLVIVNHKEEQVVLGSRFLSKSKQTPFEGKRLRGSIEKTLVRGRVVYDKDNGIQVDGGFGKNLKRT